MTHVKALQAGHSGQGTSEPITPDILGLRTRDSKADVVWVLPGRAQNSIRVLIPVDRAASLGFHDVMLDDQTSESGSIVCAKGHDRVLLSIQSGF